MQAGIQTHRNQILEIYSTICQIHDITLKLNAWTERDLGVMFEFANYKSLQ